MITSLKKKIGLHSGRATSSNSNSNSRQGDDSVPLLSRAASSTKRYMVNDMNENNSAEANDNQKPSTGQAILGLAIPALGALLIDPLMTLADTVFVGRYAENADALAGMGSAAALLTSTFFVFNFLCTATTPLVAKKRGEGDENGALTLGGQSLTLAFVLGCLVTVILLLFNQPLLQEMGTGRTGPVANDFATDFLLVRAFAAPAIFICSASTGVLRGYLDTRTPIAVLLAANAVNIALDVVLIAGAGMGPLGAAIATTTAEWISAFLFLGVLAGKLPSGGGELGSNQRQIQNEITNNKDSDLHLLTVLPALTIPEWEEVKPLVVASSSVFLRTASLQFSLLAAAAMAARGGDNLAGDSGASANVAAHQIAIQLWTLCSFICDGLAAASQGLVADALGREDQDDVRNITKTVFAYSLVQGVLLGIVLQIGSSTHFLLGAFTSDTSTQLALSNVLTLVILAQPLNSFVFAADGVLQGASEFTYQAKTMALSAATAWTSFEVLQYFNGDGAMTLEHVWCALIILQLTRGITSMVKVFDRNGPIDLLQEQQRII